MPDFDGHHLQVYAQEFSGPHDELEKRGLITEESDQYQYRWQDIACLDTGKCLFTIEHEIRSVTHPLHNRHMVNRNPSQNNRHYQMGADEWDWTLPRSTQKIRADTGAGARYPNGQAPRGAYGSDVIGIRHPTRALLPLPAYAGRGLG